MEEQIMKELEELERLDPANQNTEKKKVSDHENITIEDDSDLYNFNFVDSEAVELPLEEIKELLETKIKTDYQDAKTKKISDQKKFDNFLINNGLDSKQFKNYDEIYYYDNQIQSENMIAMVDQQTEIMSALEALQEQNEQSMNVDSTGYFFVALTLVSTLAIKTLFDNLTRW